MGHGKSFFPFSTKSKISAKASPFEYPFVSKNYNMAPWDFVHVVYGKSNSNFYER